MEFLIIIISLYDHSKSIRFKFNIRLICKMYNSLPMEFFKLTICEYIPQNREKSTTL